MRTNAPATTSALQPPAPWRLWTAALGSLILWFVYFMAAYLYTEAACDVATWASSGRGFAPDTVLFVSTLVAVALSGALTYGASRMARHTARTHRVYDDFLPKLGAAMGLLFTFVLAAHLIPIVWLGVC